MKKFLFLLLAAPTVFGQTDMVFPWVTNNTLFRSQIILNNLNNETVEVVLAATRADGESFAAIVTLSPFQQLAQNTADVFDGLNDGSGMAIVATSQHQNITGAFVITGTGSPSQSSPAQADVVSVDGGGNTLIFNYLPIKDAGASAPVVVNMGGEEALVTFQAYQNGQVAAIGGPVTVLPGRPFAMVTSDLFPNITGDMYVAAFSNQPLVGMAFIFNENLEPSMANAVSVEDFTQ